MAQKTQSSPSNGTGGAPTERCPECSGLLLTDDEHGETFCEECGLVVAEDAIDHGPEWRTYEPEETENRSRVGAPRTLLLHDNGLSSKIDWRDQDAYGNALSERQRQRMQRLRTWDDRYRTRDSKERNLKHALGEIDRMSSALGLPQTVSETAAVIYRRALDEDLLPGRSIEGTATAALYAAARQADFPRSPDEFATVSHVEATRFQRTYRYLSRELRLEIQPADPESYLARIAAEIAVSKHVERRAHELLRTAKEQSIHSGKSPLGLTAAAIYAASLLVEEPVTQSDVSDVTGISEVTIRNRYRELLEAAGATPPS